MSFIDTTKLTKAVIDLDFNCERQYKEIKNLRKTAMMYGEKKLEDQLFGYMKDFDMEMYNLRTIRKSLESVELIQEMFRLEKEYYVSLGKYGLLEEWRNYVYIKIVEKNHLLLEDLEMQKIVNLHAIDLLDGTINQINHKLSGVDKKDLHAYFVCFVKCSEIAKEILKKM